jgi:hypothetical protein
LLLVVTGALGLDRELTGVVETIPMADKQQFAY